MPEELPQRIGAYRIKKVLGRGGMGEVHLAWDERLRRHVALKRIRRRDPAVTSEQRDRLRREARAIAALVHPSIVQVYDLVQLDEADSGEGDCIVMEYVEGEPISSFLKRGALDPALALRLAREVAQGLAAAHGQGLVHRDLKADNVMVTATGHAKILDFGLALSRRQREGGWAGRAVGTVHAMAPEQILGDEVDARADLFALGVLLYEMTTGTRPFVGQDRAKILAQILDQEPRGVTEVHPRLPPALASLIHRLLRKDPGQRPANATLVGKEIAALEREIDPWSSPTGISDSGVRGLDLSESPTLSTEGAVRRSWPRSIAARGLRRLYLLFFLALLLSLGGGHDEEPVSVAEKPRRVVVLEPELVVPEEIAPREAAYLRLATAAVSSAALGHLASMPGLQPVDPREVPDAQASPTAIARSVAADEVLWSRVEPWPGIGCRISLRWVEAATATVRWTGSFEAPLGPREMRLVADSMGVYLYRAWPGRLGDGIPPQAEVRPEDFAEFLEQWREFTDTGLASAEQVARMEVVLAGSPGFLPGYLLAIDKSLTLFASARDPLQLERATAWIERAEILAPDDPRPLYRRFRAASFAGDLEAAQAVLERLELLSPGDHEVLFSGAVLAERRGDLKKARRLLLEAVERLPTWSALWRLARVEIRGGEVEAARKHLEELLVLVPRHPRGLAKLAELELLYGDLRRAAFLYEELIEERPRRSLYNNLGLIHYLERRFEEAAASYRQALGLAPHHSLTRLNLADALLALGDTAAAHDLYGQVLAALEDLRKTAVLAADEEMLVAQCLVHLGEVERGRALAWQTFEAHRDDGEIAFQASVVHALADDETATLAAVTHALALGMQPRWFAIPPFDAWRAAVDRAIAEARLPPQSG